MHRLILIIWIFFVGPKKKKIVWTSNKDVAAVVFILAESLNVVQIFKGLAQAKL